ncbi:uncharacterized protein LOC135924521 [Gordionus sp. m RMFG-2023]|uniref:uncharacterized protein LOC135924521 n=1 Tax=Gordionus sp. m RMFG-2023 TaxID=3053472 RepID=UPI0031FC1641
MWVKIADQGGFLTALCAYAPQIGCVESEKDIFFDSLEKEIQGIRQEEKLIIGADFNAHIGKDRLESGKHFSHIDYLLIRRKDLRRIKDCKVIPGEEIARQHRPLVMDLERKGFSERRKVYEPRIKYDEMLKDMPTNNKYHQKASTLLGSRKLENNVDDDWETLTEDIKETAIQILGQTKGGKALNRELW